MSMTQRIVDELRQIAGEIYALAEKAENSEKFTELRGLSDSIRALADDLGDD